MISLLSFNNLKLWLIREWLILFSPAHSYLSITTKPRLTANEIKSHLAGPNILWPEKRFQVCRNEKQQKSSRGWSKSWFFQRWWPKMKGFLLGLPSKLLVRTLKMSAFLTVLQVFLLLSTCLLMGQAQCLQRLWSITSSAKQGNVILISRGWTFYILQ